MKPSEQAVSATAVLTKAEKLEQLCRKMASIPARSDGTEPGTPSVMLRSVDDREATPIVATAPPQTIRGGDHERDRLHQAGLRSMQCYLPHS